MSIFEKIDKIGELVEKSENVPLLNKKLVNANVIMRLLEDLYASVPDEIKKAEELSKEIESKKAEAEKSSTEMVDKAKVECEKILGEAKDQAARILDENQLRAMVDEEVRRMKKEVLEEIDSMRRESLEQARELQKRALTESQRIKEEAEGYADQILRHLDSNLIDLQSAVKNGRRFLSELKEKDLMELQN